MTEEKKLLKSIVNSKRLYIFAVESDLSDVIDMRKAKHRASFSPNGNLRNSKRENGECRTVVSTSKGVDFCHIPFSRFLRTSVRRI